MIPDLLDELRRRFQVPASRKMDSHIHRLEHMLAFYESKVDIAPDRQAEMFRGFINSLRYSIATLKVYRKMTRLIHGVEAEEIEESEETDVD